MRDREAGGEEENALGCQAPGDGQSLRSNQSHLAGAAAVKVSPRAGSLGFESEEVGCKSGSSSAVENFKWTSQTFPSFVVCSLNSASGPAAKLAGHAPLAAASLPFPSRAGRGRGRGRRKGGRHGHRPPPSLSSPHSRSMPLIQPRSEFGSLLRRRSQVGFRSGVQPGFRYETLCLQGNDVVTSSPHSHVASEPMSIVGPWITS